MQCEFNQALNTYQYADPPCTHTTNRVCKNCATCPVGTACYCPDPSGVCQGPAGGDRTKCQACPAGYYRMDVGTLACVKCAECPNGYKKIKECDAQYNTRILNDCEECAAETYISPSKTECLTCATCDEYSRVVIACSSTKQRTCEACPTGTKAPGINLQCTRCADGYYPIAGYQNGARQGDCSPCTNPTIINGAACGSGYWVLCTGGTRVCRICDGHTGITGSASCALGNGVPGTCSGQSNANVACSPCAAGTERLSTTPLVSGVQVCAQCRTGTYKLATGVVDCTNCANKPDNSVYTAWGVGAATTQDCPW